MVILKKSAFAAVTTFTFLFSSIFPVYQVDAIENLTLSLPIPGTMVHVSKPFAPVMLQGLSINPQDPLSLDFIVSKGDAIIGKEQYAEEIEQLARYFLASMAIPEDQLWVNLSPFEKEKVITDSLSKTEMGQIMLAQDYLLKQLTASMIYPEKALGKEFWSRVYKQTKEQFGDAKMPVNTFNKVWILADTANAVEKNNAVLITDAHLKVMLEEDYLAKKKSSVETRFIASQTTNRTTQNILRDIILPEIEKEINAGANFAPLRQVFNAFVISVWYKKNLKQSIFNQVYSDKSKLGGIEAQDPKAKQKIYDRYIQAYKKGAFNYIKEETVGQQRGIPRKYFSGGEVISAKNVRFNHDPVMFERVVKDQAMDSARVKFDMATRRDDRGNFDNVIDRVNADNLPETAIEILEKKTIDITSKTITEAIIADTKSLGIPVKIKVRELADASNVLNGKEIIQHGYMIKYFRDLDAETYAVIYVTSSFNKTITQNNGLFHFFLRKIYKIYGEGGNAGRQEEVNLMKAKIEEEKQNNKGKSKLEKALIKRIPEGSFPWVLLERELRALLIDPTLPENERTLQYFEDRVRQIFPQRIFTKIIPPGKFAYDASREAYELFKNQANEKFINAMDFIANYAEPLPNKVAGMIERLKQGKTISFTFGASKYNPSSIAHMAITLDGAFSKSGASSYIVNVTFEDVRKPSVKKSAKSRLILAKDDIEGIFGELFTILDVNDPVDGRDLGKFNGEEVYYLILKTLIPHGLKGPQYYVAGEDHYFVWTPLLNNKANKTIQWDLMENDNVRQHYTFYVNEFNGEGWRVYQELVRRQDLLSKDLGPSTLARSFYSEEDTPLDRNTKESIINGIIQAKSKDQLLGILNQAPVLPRLDTAGKAVAINSAVEPAVNAVLVVPHRHNARGEDRLRDDLIDEMRLIVMPMEGIKNDVSATLNRKFLELISIGVFDYNFGYGLTIETMQNMNKNPEIFRILVRQSNVKLPLALPLLMPELSPLQESKDSKKIELANNLGKLGFTYKEGITDSGNESFIRVYDDTGKEIVTTIYSVINSLDEHEGGKLKDKNIIEFLERTVKDRDNPKAQEALRLVEFYAKSLNDAAMLIKKDVHLASKQNAVGGIELNQKDLKLNIIKDGKGIEFKMDPALLQELQSVNFGGFKPTVLSITPMTSPAVLN